MTREETVVFSLAFLACVSICSFSSVYWYTWYTWHTFYMFLGVASMWVPCDLHRMRSRRVVKEDCWLPRNCVLLASACHVPLTSWAGELVSWLGTVCYGLLACWLGTLQETGQRKMRWTFRWTFRYFDLVDFQSQFLAGWSFRQHFNFPSEFCCADAQQYQVYILGLFASFVNEPARKPPRQLVQS